MPTVEPRRSSALTTPFPLQGVMARMDGSDAHWTREIRAWLCRPSAIEGEDPRVLAAYCFDLLTQMLRPEEEAGAMDCLQRFCAMPRTVLARRTPEVIKEYLRPALMHAWCLETCVELLQTRWSSTRPSTGQHIVTALFVQECLDGYLLYASVDDHGIHVWNQLPDKTHLDLTAEQFLCGRRIVVTPGVISRERLLARSGVRESYDHFRTRIVRALIACGIAASSLAYAQRWHPPDGTWDDAG